jgi:hypothetical protein
LRLVYIDEAGISNRAQEPFLTVAGIIVDADNKLNAIENYLERLVNRHIPEEHRSGFVFHATELFNGGGKIFKREKADLIGPHEWPLERRLRIADELAAIPQKFDLPIALGWIDRANFPKAFDIPKEMPESYRTIAAHVCAFLNCEMIAEQWMRKYATNEICMLIVEDNDQARKNIREVHTYHQEKKLAQTLDENELKYFPLRKIKEDPLFQPKKPSNPLIVADFCAYVWKKYLMKDQRYDRFFEPFKNKLVSFEDSWLNRPRGRRARSVRR